MVFVSRVQEGKDIRAGVEGIQAKIKVLQDEESALRKHLAQVSSGSPIFLDAACFRVFWNKSRQ